MSESVQHITNAQGEKAGVLLNLETYQQLTNLSADTELLIGLSLDELQALVESVLSPKTQTQLDKLLMKNSENQLSNEEFETLDKLLAQVDQLNILKTRARYTLNQLPEKPNK
ncbi:MAG: hypothetical protein HCA25_17825 [Dolichospermum sp. DET50]|nr:hypothetical protein [Dolichospermum sp. DET66]MBS3034077.1 hypothetical protein [Dolichospermum sp. DET67]MBS3039280.1 hypothetical protein [Dolichospermum sp. DET50]QSX66508.1 MAG: hypothetical protein EZY12_17095 [Dolichospermum sp. DET69]